MKKNSRILTSLSSEKFKHLNSLNKMLPDNWVIPKYCTLDKNLAWSEYLEYLTPPLILRSSLEGEATKKMLSGRSISIKDITNADQFLQALTQVESQVGFDQAILQDYKDVDHHYTIFCNFDYIYMEDTRTVNRYFVSSLLQSKNIPKQVKGLAEGVRIIQNFLDYPYLQIELGITGNLYYLFQCNEIHNKQLNDRLEAYCGKTYLPTNPGKKIGFLQSLLFTCQSWWFLERTTLEHYRTSEKHRLKNWDFVLFYFAIFTLKHDIRQGQTGYMEFLKWARNSEEELARRASSHIQFIKHAAPQAPNHLQFSNQKINFGGKGKKIYLKKHILMLSTLDPEAIYTAENIKLFLSTSNSVLGHGAIAIIESEQDYVLGIDKHLWSKLMTASSLEIDFERETVIYY